MDLPGARKLSEGEAELVSPDGETASLVVRETQQHGTATESHALLLGDGYASSDDAEGAAARWVPLVQRVLAGMRIGAVIGGRDPEGLAQSRVAREGDRGERGQFVEDEPGVLVFPSEKEPHFVETSSSGWAGFGPARVAELIGGVDEVGGPLRPSEQTAFELYSSSQTATSIDAQFILLMMAVEAVIEPQPRSDVTVAHVDDLMRQTSSADLPAEEKQSLKTTLQFGRQESIGQAGRRLTRALRPKLYLDQEPDRFFSKAYSLRSRLVHGLDPRPSRDEIAECLPALEEMVADLLMRPHAVPDEQGA